MRKLALLLLVAPLALAACGGSGSTSVIKGDPVAYVKHAAQKTADMTSEHMTMTGSVSVGAMAITMTGSGDFSNVAKQGRMSASMTLADRHVKMDEVIDGTTVYVRSPMFASQLPSGKTWVKLDLQKVAASKGIDFSSLMSENPTQALRQLEAAGSVSRVGAETIDGVETTHYRVTHLDVTKLPQGAKIQALAHPKYGPVDVWIGNKDGFVYRESMSFTYSFSGHSASMAMRVDLSNFGEAVHVAVPPASKTLDVQQQLAQQGLGG